MFVGVAIVSLSNDISVLGCLFTGETTEFRAAQLQTKQK
jgi:hypothetical protein